MSITDHGVATATPEPRLTEPGAGPRPCDAREEFGEIVAVHHQRLARLAFLLCSNRQQAEDAVAEAYAKVWPRFRRGAIDDIGPYLRQAVVNQIRGGFRRRVVERRDEQRQIIDLGHADRSVDSGERSVDARASLTPAIAALPAAQRNVIVLRYYEDLSERDTAQLLGVSVGTVKSRAARGLQRLRVLVGDIA